MENYLTAKISASAVRANLALLREQLRPGTKLCAVVKANCYGHGVKLLLPILTDLADILAVTSAQEAFELRDLGYRGPVLMLFSTFSIEKASLM